VSLDLLRAKAPVGGDGGVAPLVGACVGVSKAEDEGEDEQDLHVRSDEAKAGVFRSAGSVAGLAAHEGNLGDAQRVPLLAAAVRIDAADLGGARVAAAVELHSRRADRVAAAPAAA